MESENMDDPSNPQDILGVFFLYFENSSCKFTFSVTYRKMLAN